MKSKTCAAALAGLILMTTAANGEGLEKKPENTDWDAQTASGPGDQLTDRVYRPRRTAVVITNGAGGGMLVRSQISNRYAHRTARQEGDVTSRTHDGISLERTR